MTLRIERHDAVARIVLSRPERHNAQNPDMWRNLRAAGAGLAGDESVRVVVLAGDGPSFSSGLDLGELAPDGFLGRMPGLSAEEAMAAIRAAQEAFTWIESAPFPVIAAVHGNALGAGFQLALACDFRIVTEDARLALAEMPRGLVPDLGATSTLPRLIGMERALELILTGRRIDGAEAVRLGLALRCVPAENLEEESMNYARSLAKAPRAALAHAKAATYEPDGARSLRIAAAGQVECVRALLPERG
ncbi:enoyl-CoA hydratase/isomerase family protein [Amycolatopsis sp. K13G38]|uniref:Enoyl-CoA hydratase/isomerase family protein n=1 Tax=Amycolatopsis acididurans TaxID=2724524 RepID=A0ABX1JDM2_9PSEU|nr:enoyl-CoA hydratase/isomerase family protein [Amycolatopsis acididurans]NKQ56964.1 enoyl-CoA hydratase/isomerase family protein [Amycolatopsis acididurans]